MSLPPKTYFTPEEYLELERKAEYKSEYFNGEIFATGGASPRHRSIDSFKEYVAGLGWWRLELEQN